MKKQARIFTVITALLLTLSLFAGCSDNIITTTPATDKNTASTEKAKFSYVHDPRENPTAMEDIVENPDAVYGFSPSPNSKRLKNYVSYDWTDPDVVEKARLKRVAYHKSIEGMFDILRQMRDEGKSIEEMARAVSAERNRIRLDSYKNDPEGLKKVKESNLEKYGREEGPTPEMMYEKCGSWEQVLVSAFGTNPGMDACLGLYDEQYPLYIELGLIKAES